MAHIMYLYTIKKCYGRLYKERIYSCMTDYSTLPKVCKRKPFLIYCMILQNIPILCEKWLDFFYQCTFEDKLWKVKCSRSWFGNIMKCSWKTPTFLDIEKRWLSEKKLSRINSFKTIHSKILILNLKRKLNTTGETYLETHRFGI